MPRFSRCGCVTLFALLAVLVPSLLHANPLPPAFGSQVFSPFGVVYSGFPIYYDATAFNSATYISPFSYGNVGFSALTHGGIDPSVMSRLAVSGALSTSLKFYSISIAGYYFEVNGPANQSVTVNFASEGFAFAPTNSFGSGASLSISDGADSIFAAFACAGDTSHLSNGCINTINAPSSFKVNTTVDIQTDTAYLVRLWTETYYSAPNGSSFPGGEARAGVDPTITLAISDPNYSLSFSPGLAPVKSPVPEPGTFALILPGLAALGRAYRSRQRSQIRTSVTS